MDNISYYINEIFNHSPLPYAMILWYIIVDILLMAVFVCHGKQVIIDPFLIYLAQKNVNTFIAIFTACLIYTLAAIIIAAFGPILLMAYILFLKIMNIFRYVGDKNLKNIEP